MAKISTLGAEEVVRVERLGRKHNKILRELWEFIRPGVDVMEVEEFYKGLLEKYNVSSACLGYTANKTKPPYPANLCIGINSDCVHTYPVKGKVIKETDLVVVDTVITDGEFYTDAAFSKPMQKASKIKKKISDVTRQSLLAAVNILRGNIKVGEVSHVIYRTVRQAGFDVLYEYGGHGIGRHMWEEPFVPNYGDISQGPILPPGALIAIEPLVVSGSPEIIEIDEWATRLKDGGGFSHWEATVLVRPTGAKIIAGII